MDVYGLIGYPLGHSFSKKYFTDKFEKENISNCRFELFPIEQISLFRELLINQHNLKGLAVTIPYKESIIDYLDHLDEDASKVAAVNCIKFSKGKLTGYNTDIIGFEKSLLPLLKNNHTHALVLGSGGSSKAVQYVLKKIGISYLVVSRKESLTEMSVSYEMLNENFIKAYPLIINTTPAGMSPNENAEPKIPYQCLDKNNLLFDLIYSPAQTNFLRKGVERSAVIKNGYEMLVIQAEENWRIWNEL